MDELIKVKDIVQNIYTENKYIREELNNLLRSIDDTIDNINDIETDINSYNIQKKKQNAIMKLFFPYIIATSTLIDDINVNDTINNLEHNRFNKSFIRKVLEKYIEQ